MEYVVTYGFVKDVDCISRWPYRVYQVKNCLVGVKEKGDKFYSRRYDKEHKSFVLT